MTARTSFDDLAPGRIEADLLMIGRDRMFYSGRLRRRLAPRQLGALSIYAAPDAPFEIGWPGTPRALRQICAVPAHVEHHILPPDGRLWNICVEPDSVDATALDALAVQINGLDPGAPVTLKALRLADDRLRRAGARVSGFSTGEFDRLVLGGPLTARTVDPRIKPALNALRDAAADDPVSADDCAALAGLSVSRFLRLFKEEAGIPFRSARMWHRARRFLDRAACPVSLTGVAHDLGYPDAAHFSRSIHRTFGMQPRTLRRGARELLVVTGQDYRMPAG